MHIPDGILPVAVSAAGYVTAGAGTWYALKQIEKKEDPRAEIPKAALLAAAFFVSTWVHIPIPPTSVHLILGGLMGILLGWYAVPSILIGLFLQAVMFQHGGIVTLGVNTTMIAFPAIVAHYVFKMRHYVLKGNQSMSAGVFGFLGGATGVLLTILIAFSVLILTVPGNIDVAAERTAITALAIAHLPLALIEGVATGFVVSYLHKVRPEILGSTPQHLSAEPAGEPVEVAPVAGD